MSHPIELMVVGDLILGAASVDDIDRKFDSARPLLQTADLAIGHVEWPHTDRGRVSSADMPAPAAPPGNLAAVARAGFGAVTLAGNHIFDQGHDGVVDTIDGLTSVGLGSVGAGRTLAEARIPLVVERGGLTVGVLSYNAVGPRESWATPAKAGAAYMRIHAHYEVEMASPGSPPTEFTAIDAESLDALHHDIGELAARVDIVLVTFHKGIVFERARLAQYERPLARAAIDAGADVVIGHHAHILRGVEVYKERPIFHGVNHFALAYPAHGNPADPASTARTRPTRSPILDLVEPDRSVPNFPFSRESRHTMVARIIADSSGVRRAGFTPCYIDDRGVTVVSTDAGAADATVRYVGDITREAGLQIDLRWTVDQAIFYERNDQAASRR